MRKVDVFSVKTVDFSEIYNFGKYLIKNNSPAETLRQVNEKYLRPTGIKYILENIEYQKKLVPEIIHQTDEKTDESGISIKIKEIEGIEEYKPNFKEEVSQRILLLCDRASRDHKIQAASEANGIVIEYKTWAVLSYPPPALSFNMSHQDIEKCLKIGLYKIFRADFGTIVTLYYFNDKWRISSANGYEIDNMIWIGTRTFRDLIDEVFNKYSLDVDTLNKKYCYSFGFHHYEYHPFNGAGQLPIRAWFIRAIDLDTFHIMDNGSIGCKIPMQQESVELNKLAAIDSAMAIKKIYEICENSYTKYITEKTSTPIYGFILISNNPVENANVLIESKLQCKLRQLICRRPPSELNPEKRFNWMMINASMDSIDNKPIFRKLFPQTIDSGEKFDKLILNLATKIVGIYNRESVTYSNTQFDQIVKFIIEQMKERNAHVNKSNISIKIVQHFLCQSNFAYLYASIL
jgi:hypothetical protein